MVYIRGPKLNKLKCVRLYAKRVHIWHCSVSNPCFTTWVIWAIDVTTWSNVTSPLPNPAPLPLLHTFRLPRVTEANFMSWFILLHSEAIFRLVSQSLFTYHSIERKTKRILNSNAIPDTKLFHITMYYPHSTLYYTILFIFL